MNNPLTSEDLMAKAQRASTSAQILLNDGDTDGASNRAYYAMFDAAKAALIANDPTSERDFGKTHSGLLKAFSGNLIVNGPVPKEMGRVLKRAEGFRIVADYKGDAVTMSDAQELVKQAVLFVTEMKSIFKIGVIDDV